MAAHQSDPFLQALAQHPRIGPQGKPPVVSRGFRKLVGETSQAIPHPLVEDQAGKSRGLAEGPGGRFQPPGQRNDLASDANQGLLPMGRPFALGDRGERAVGDGADLPGIDVEAVRHVAQSVQGIHVVRIRRRP